MNIIEALRSGKRFKRPCDKVWLEKYDGCLSEIVRTPVTHVIFTAEDILTNDWEIEETIISLTEAQIRCAFNQALRIAEGMSWQRVCDKTVAILGFK